MNPQETLAQPEGESFNLYLDSKDYGNNDHKIILSFATDWRSMIIIEIRRKQILLKVHNHLHDNTMSDNDNLKFHCHYK